MNDEIENVELFKTSRSRFLLRAMKRPRTCNWLAARSDYTVGKCRAVLAAFVAAGFAKKVRIFGARDCYMSTELGRRTLAVYSGEGYCE